MPLVLSSPTALTIPDPVLTALIALAAGVIVAVLSNWFHRSREHTNWLREQLFKTANDLMEAKKDFSEAMSQLPRVRLGGSIDFHKAHELLRAHDFTELGDAMGRYENALRSLRMLTLDTRTRAMTLEALRASRHSYTDSLLPPTPDDAADIGDPYTAKQFNDRATEPWLRLSRTHDAVLERITTTHFATWRERSRQQLRQLLMRSK